MLMLHCENTKSPPKNNIKELRKRKILNTKCLLGCGIISVTSLHSCTSSHPFILRPQHLQHGAASAGHLGTCLLCMQLICNYQLQQLSVEVHKNFWSTTQFEPPGGKNLISVHRNRRKMGFAFSCFTTYLKKRIFDFTVIAALSFSLKLTPIRRSLFNLFSLLYVHTFAT